jgi:undecaprenyl diphosphate synthase
MGLLRYYLQHEVAYLHKHEIRLRFIGNRNQLPVDIVKLIDSAEFQTRNNHALTLTIALSYGGRAEIVEATRRVAEKVAMRTVSPSDIDEEMLAENLYTADIPDPDLLIRTSGEKRISNFLLWQLAYAELIFVDTLWPDFSQEDFAEALSEFQRRERRYGAAGA